MPEFTKEALLTGIARWIEEDGPLPRTEARAYLDSLEKAKREDAEWIARMKGEPEPPKERTPEEILEMCSHRAKNAGADWDGERMDEALRLVRALREERDELRRRIVGLMECAASPWE